MRGFLSAFFLSLLFGTLQAQKFAGLLSVEPGTQPGYILYNPTTYKEAFLIDECGRVVNKWTSQYIASHTLYLKPDGALLRTRAVANPAIEGGGAGGGVELLDWNSNLLWEFTYSNALVRHHHDIYPMPNGNVLILAWEKKTGTEAVAEGRNPALIPDNEVWPEHIIEVRPIVPDGGEIVWEWHAWDHLVQDFDDTKENFGTVEDHPELIDLNYTDDGKKDWLHANAIDYNPQLDQIMISVLSFDELWVIDHGTTKAQAATHTGGRQGKGGDILYRWGNPMAYRKGTSGDAKLFRQHHTHWIANGLPQAGRIMVFNNAPLRLYSSVEIIEPPVNSTGGYTMGAAGRFGPENASTTYSATPPSSLFSRNMGSAQMLPNGNLFIGSAVQGIVTEVTPLNEIIWKYKSPFTVTGIVGLTDMTINPDYQVRPNFRAIKYPIDYPAFTSRILVPGDPIEGLPWADCNTVTGLEEKPISNLAFPNPADDKLTVTSPGCFQAAVTDGMGRKVYEGNGNEQLNISTSGLSPGLYLLRVGAKTEKVLIRH